MDQQIEQIIAHIATVSGRSHDLGKNTVFFQKKLRDKGKAQAKDPIRHEWLSYLVLAFMRQRQSFDEAFAQSIALLSKPKKLDNQKPDWFKSLSTPWDVVEAVVATHHKLFVGERDLEICHHAPVIQEPKLSSVDARMFGDLNLNLIDDLKEAIQSISSPNHLLFWRYVTLRARQAMILADHLVSAQTPPRQAKKKEPMANSKNKQPLDWHLKTVSQVASDVAKNMHHVTWPCLDQETVERIIQPSDDPRFVWQDHAKEALQCANPLPTLVFNMAGTGSGKTRANVKIICALRGKHDVRFTTALNLRTLTLQTADAYRDETGIPEHDLICVIGEKAIRDLHEQSRMEDEDEEEDEADSEVILSSGHPPPEFLEALKHHGDVSMLMPPVLVSTVDTIVRAGMPQYHAHHALQYLRVQSGDLILDEIDSYDPDGLTAVLRLLTVAGEHGRHVVIASATLPEPIVKAASRAYHFGVATRLAINGQTAGHWRVAMVHDRSKILLREVPVNVNESQVPDTPVELFRQVKSNLYKHPTPTTKLAYIQDSERSEAGLFEAVAKACLRLHHDHRWSCLGKTISFGLVRVAHIKTAIKLARFLSKYFSGRALDVRIAAYHAQDFLIQRHYKEKRLDFLLTRKNSNKNIESDPEIKAILDQAKGPDVLFIVVATPVEEVGRDHDFDYAVIEPSSMHSIIQTAGRVNRHRQTPIKQPNIALLRYNAKIVRNEKPAFANPGFETGHEEYKDRYPHDIAALIDMEQDIVRLHDRHRFAALDENAINKILNKSNSKLSRFLDPQVPFFLNLQTCNELRNDEHKQTFYLDEQDRLILCYEKVQTQRSTRHGKVMIDLNQPDSSDVWLIERAENDFLALDVDAMRTYTKKIARGLALEHALSVSMRADRDIEKILHWDQSFGFYHQRDQ